MPPAMAKRIFILDDDKDLVEIISDMDRFFNNHSSFVINSKSFTI